MKKNRLWILRPVEGCRPDPWDPWYDKCFGFVVCAQTEDEARKIASSEAGDEAGFRWDENRRKNPWLNGDTSTCDILKASDDVGVVMRDFYSA